VVNLEDFAALPAVVASPADRAVLDRVLAVLADAPPDTPVSGVEALLSKARAIPRSNPYLRRSVLTTLAECGALPQPALPSRLDRWAGADEEFRAWRALGISHRSDVPMPLAAWRGGYGVDAARVRLVFGTAG
jgi:hypothetical protein